MSLRSSSMPSFFAVFSIIWRSEEHTSELQSRQYLLSFPAPRSSDLRVEILRRTALHHIADVNVLAKQFDAFLFRRVFDHLGEQLSGAADERDALRVLVCAGAFTDEDQRGLWIANAEDDLVAGLGEAAAAAIAHVLDDLK